MPIEQFDNIDDLDPLNPLDDDPVSEGDDHLRGIKNALRANVTGDDLETRLMVASIIRAFVDASRMTAIDELLVKGNLMDVDQSAISAISTMRVRAQNGGYAFLNEQNGNFQINQIAANAAFEATIIAAVRDAEVILRYNNTIAIKTDEGVDANSRGIVKDSGGLDHPIGFNNLPQITPGGNFTVTPAENGTRQRTGNTGVTVTLPTTGLPAGFTFILQKGTVTGVGFDTIATSGTLRWYKGDEILTGNRQLQQGGICTIAMNSNGVFDIWGNGLS